MENTYDIDDKVQVALDWAFKTYGCEGCNGKTDHDPICRLTADITADRGANGRVVILNPHPSVL